MNRVLVDREWLKRLHRDLDACQKVIWLGLRGADPAYCQDAQDRLKEIDELLAQPAEAEGVELVPFWVLFDATTPEPFIKKHMPEGVLAFFDNEEDARRAKALHPGTDYKRAPYVRAAALSAVTAERDRLAAALSAPDTIKAEPAGDYDNLRKQFLSLRMLANSNAKMVHHWRAQCDRETREALLANAASVNAERDTNSMLTDALETAERERDQLRAEVDALRKDAERYRWLRDPCSGAEHVIYYSRGDYGRGLMSGSMLDAAIDAALAAKEA